MKYKIIQLNKITEEYKKLGLSIDSTGLILSEINDNTLVMFFNGNNYGDYLIHLIKKSDLKLLDMVLPDELCNELETYIEKNIDTIAKKFSFEEIPFKDCDYVELIVEKENYSKFGLHKGDKGVVASDNATRNKMLIDFGKETDNFDGFISVDYNDVKKVDN